MRVGGVIDFVLFDIALGMGCWGLGLGLSELCGFVPLFGNWLICIGILNVDN